jgi:hypothetical protein
VDPANPVYNSSVINDPLGTWDTDTGPTAEPDGNYEVRVVGTDECGNTETQTRLIRIDNTWPMAEITAPLECLYLTGVVQVFGTASDANLNSWTLQYTGGDSSGWVTINSGNTSVAGGLLGNWDTTGLRPCAYTLRLVVTDDAVISCNSANRHRTEYKVSVNVGIRGDYDGDGDVDLFDYSQFQLEFTGP